MRAGFNSQNSETRPRTVRECCKRYQPSDKNGSALGGARLMLLLGESVLLLFFRLFAHGLVRR